MEREGDFLEIEKGGRFEDRVAWTELWLRFGMDYKQLIKPVPLPINLRVVVRTRYVSPSYNGPRRNYCNFGYE